MLALFSLRPLCAVKRPGFLAVERETWVTRWLLVSAADLSPQWHNPKAPKKIRGQDEMCPMQGRLGQSVWIGTDTSLTAAVGTPSSALCFWTLTVIHPSVWSGQLCTLECGTETHLLTSVWCQVWYVTHGWAGVIQKKTQQPLLWKPQCPTLARLCTSHDVWTDDGWNAGWCTQICVGYRHVTSGWHYALQLVLFRSDSNQRNLGFRIH